MSIPDEVILNAVREFWKNPDDFHRPFPTDMLAQQGYDIDEVYEAMEDLNGRDILDYGVSVRTSWIVGEEPV